MDQSIASDKLQIERKLFFFDLKENQRGILLRITEDVRGHRDTIIIPATGLKDFAASLQKMIAVIDQEGLDPSDPLAYDEEDTVGEDEDLYDDEDGDYEDDEEEDDY